MKLNALEICEGTGM